MKRMYFILTFVLFAVSSLSAQTTENLLAAGNLNEWTMFVGDSTVNPATIFKLDNGIMRIEGQPFGFIRTNKTYENFVLIAQWRWVGTPTNSGIFIYLQDEMKLWPNMIECQLASGRSGDLMCAGGARFSNSPIVDERVRPIPKKYDSSENPAGEWNTAVITAMNGNVSVVINGVLQNEGIDSLHKSGHIALQSEGGPLEFRNVTVTQIP